MGNAIVCQGCGIEAPSKYIEYHQNIGALVVRFTRSYKGNMCKRCMHRYFWKSTMTTLFLGPWGTISVFLSPIFVVMNVVRYLTALGMPPVPEGASVPQLDNASVERLAPYTDQIITRLNNSEPLESVAGDVARQAAVTPGQVALFVVALAEQARNVPPPPPPTGGFPVIPVAGTAAPVPPPPPLPPQALPPVQ